jgi:hypothetical protein
MKTWGILVNNDVGRDSTEVLLAQSNYRCQGSGQRVPIVPIGEKLRQ